MLFKINKIMYIIYNICKNYLILLYEIWFFYLLFMVLILLFIGWNYDSFGINMIFCNEWLFFFLRK